MRGSSSLPRNALRRLGLLAGEHVVDEPFPLLLTNDRLPDHSALLQHVMRGLQGRMQLADLVYFGSSVATLLFLTYRVVESHRWR